MVSEENTVKKFLRTESHTSQSGIVMEEDVYVIYLKVPMIGTSGLMVTTDTPIGFVYENKRPKGQLFKGRNRKERRISKALMGKE